MNWGEPWTIAEAEDIRQQMERERRENPSGSAGSGAPSATWTAVDPWPEQNVSRQKPGMVIPLFAEDNPAKFEEYCYAYVGENPPGFGCIVCESTEHGMHECPSTHEACWACWAG
jgi:hypothetical protein